MFQRSLLAAAFCLGAWSPALAAVPQFDSYTQSLRGRKIIANGLFAEKVPHLEGIEKELPYLKSDVDFFNYLDKNFPHLLDNFVLVHHSESQQLSSLAHPRIILFGGGAAFTFSEEPSQKNRKVEMLFANPKTYEVSLHELSFEKDRAILNKNPASCLACHGSPSRPLWNPYDFWPQSYGSAIGMMGTQGEKDAYLQLLRKAAQSPLLSRLPLPANYTLGDEAVTAFTQYILKLNMGRWIYQNLPPGGPFDAFAKPFIAVAGLCLNETEGSNLTPVDFKKLPDFFPPSLLASQQSLLDHLRRDQSVSRKHFKSYLEAKQKEIFPDLQYLFKVDHARLQNESDMLATMRWVFAMAGVNTQDLSSSLIGNDTLISVPSDFSMEFLLSLLELRPDLFTDIPFTESMVTKDLAFMNLLCDKLAPKSHQALRNSKTAPQLFQVYTEDVLSRPVISRCSKCHVEHLGDAFNPAPSIPFDNPFLLSQLLRAPDSKLKVRIEKRISTNGPGQMPPLHPLSQKEKEALMSYLENLSD